MDKTDVLNGPIKIRYKGLYDFDGLYRLVYNWMQKRIFEYHEDLYKDKVETALGNEIEIKVWGDRKVTEYIKYKVTVDYHLWESKEVSVVIDGKNVKRMQGRMEVKINAEVITDWQKKYKNYPLLEAFLQKVVFKREIDLKHVDPFDKDLHKLSDEIKRFLKMDSS